MSNLSPAAQAVAWAYDNTPEKDTGNHRYHWLVSALRAAADQVECIDPDDNAFAAGYDTAIGDLLAIAAELEAHHG